MVKMNEKTKSRLLIGGLSALGVVLVVVLTVSLGGKNSSDTPSATDDRESFNIEVNDIPENATTNLKNDSKDNGSSISDIDITQSQTDPDPVLNVEDETDVQVNLTEADKPDEPVTSLGDTQEHRPSGNTDRDNPPTDKVQENPTEKSTETKKTDTEKPNNGDKKNGQIYVEGFGWIEDGGGGSIGIDVGEEGDELTGNKVGQMD